MSRGYPVNTRKLTAPHDDVEQNDIKSRMRESGCCRPWNRSSAFPFGDWRKEIRADNGTRAPKIGGIGSMTSRHVRPGQLCPQVQKASHSLSLAQPVHHQLIIITSPTTSTLSPTLPPHNTSTFTMASLHCTSHPRLWWSESDPERANARHP